jgi:hypothetical protein
MAELWRNQAVLMAIEGKMRLIPAGFSRRPVNLTSFCGKALFQFLPA